ncbi:hypothetical protein JV46_13620 [Solemya velum gill symbiont]|uniref:Uncharacterized protein n=1 Tax=Solemya velum gill symbiont TaxID=2340 RepID=A0A0B0HDE6_SOVGS|nr:hypothetical protein JV46_13620 [Solemya velum gill symbiont]
MPYSRPETATFNFLLRSDTVHMNQHDAAHREGLFFERS